MLCYSNIIKIIYYLFQSLRHGTQEATMSYHHRSRINLRLYFARYALPLISWHDTGLDSANSQTTWIHCPIGLVCVIQTRIRCKQPIAVSPNVRFSLFFQLNTYACPSSKKRQKYSYTPSRLNLFFPCAMAPQKEGKYQGREA